MPTLPIPSFLPPQPELCSTAPSSCEEHTDQWISISFDPSAEEPRSRKISGGSMSGSGTGTASDGWHASVQDQFRSSMFPAAQSSPVRTQSKLKSDIESESEADATTWARHVESYLLGLSPAQAPSAPAPKRNRRSHSVDELGLYPAVNTSHVSVRERIAQVQPQAHGRSRSQADLLPTRPAKKDKNKENKHEKLKKEKTQNSPSSNSLSRRASAPLLGSFGNKKRNKPVQQIDTSPRSYVRPGVTPPTTSRPISPALQLSTFGTVYVPGWDSPRPEHIPRPSTAPLPSFDFNFGFSNLAPASPASPSDTEELGGVHYSTYGSRASQIYEQNPFSNVLPPDMPFASASVPVPPSLLVQTQSEEKEKGGHKRSGSQGLMLASALLRKVGREDSSATPTPTTATSPTTPEIESRSRKMTMTSLAETLQSRFTVPETPEGDTIKRSPTLPSDPTSVGVEETLSGARPTTPAVPDFLAASRSMPGGMESGAETEGPDEVDATAVSAESRPKLRTRASLLALVSSSRPNTSIPSTPSGQNTSPPSTAQPRSPTSPTGSSPRPRSALMRLAARFTGPSGPGSPLRADESFAPVDASFATEDGWADDSFSSGVTIDDSAAGQVASPTAEFRELPSVSKPEGPTTFPTPASPTYTRSRTLSKLSMTSRRILSKVERPLPGTFGGRPASSRRPSAFSTSSSARRRGMSDASSKRSRIDSTTRRASADKFSAEGAIEGTVMYGVGEEMLRLMFGGPLPASEGPPQLPDQQAPEPRERTRSLPRRVSAPKAPRADLATLFTPSATEHEAKAIVPSPEDIGLLPDFGGSLDLKFPNPVSGMTPVPPPSTSHIAPNPRRKGHRRGTTSKENVHVGAKIQVKSRSRSKSAPLGVSAELQKSLAPVRPGILTNGNTPTSQAARVVIVNSATTSSGPGTPRRTTRSNPMPIVAGESNAAGNSADASLANASPQLNPGVVVTAPTPPAPRRSLSVPLDMATLSRASEAGSSADATRGSVSRGTSVQFVPESLEGPRRSRMKRGASSFAGSIGEISENGKGKRKVEREETDGSVTDPGRDSPSKKPRLNGEEVDVTFMGEPLFGGVPQKKRGWGSLDRASSHHSARSFHHPNPRYSYPNPYANSPSPRPTSPVESPDPERASIPLRAIVTPRVQSLHEAGSDYFSHRQSIGSIQRPKSRQSARSNATGARSNMTGARSTRTNASGGGPKSLKDRLPLQGWCFVFGFFMPLIWWYAAVTRAERGYYGGGMWSRDLETQWEGVKTKNKDEGRIDAHTWRFRCRLMAVFSVVIYVPVIVLAAVFAR